MRLKPNEFSSYDLTQQEEAKGWNFSLLNQAVIRNEQATIAGKILTIRAEAGILKEEEVKQLAYYQGQLDLLKHILAQVDLFSQDLDLAIQEEQQTDMPQ